MSLPSFSMRAPTRLLGIIIVALGLIGHAPVARAADITLTGLRYDIGFMKLDIPRMDVRGTSLTEAELRAVLDPAAPEPAAQRLARLEAATVLMPEVKLEQRVDGSSQITIYRDVVLSDVVRGVIGRLGIASASGSAVDQASGQMNYRAGEITGEGIDLPHTATVLTGTNADPAAVALLPLYRQIAYRDYVIDLPANGGQISVGRLAVRDSKARAGKEPLVATLSAIMQLSEKQAADAGSSSGDTASDDIAILARLLPFFDHFEYGVMDAEAIKGSFKGDKEQAEFSIAAMRYSDQAQSPGFAMSNLHVASGPARLSLAEFEMRDFSFAESLRALADAIERNDLMALMTTPTRLIPKLGTIRLKGLAIEAPDTSAPGQNGQPQMFRASVKSLELGVAAQLDGIPTAIRFAAEEVAAPLPTTAQDQAVRDLIAMGIKDINLSWLADLAWQEQTERLDIRSLDFAAKDLLSATITGQLSNVSKDAFAPDAALAQMAWLSAAAQRLSLNVQNAGGLEKIVAREAAKARKTPEALRREWGTLAAIGLPAILGDSDGAKTLTSAVSRFIARPGTLAIEMNAKSPSGVGVADAISVIGAPRTLFDKITLQARAD